MSRHILLYALIPLFVITAAFGFTRFLENKDYAVTYESDCDPATESCFIGCEDDSCEVLYYYSYIEKRATDVYAQCGQDITECDAAYMCTESDTYCSITYCDPEVDGDACELFDIPVEEASEESIEEETPVAEKLPEGEITEEAL